MLRSHFSLFLLLTVSLFFSCTSESLEGGDIQFKMAPTKIKTSLPCETGFLSIGNAPGTVITIINASTGAIVSSFTVMSWGQGTDYVTLETGTTYEWISDTCLPGSVLYCSCGDNLGTLTLEPIAPSFTTSNSSAPYTECSF